MKQIKKEYLERDVEFDGNLEDFIKDLQEYLDDYPTSVIKVESDYIRDEDYEHSGNSLSIYRERLETDEEEATRIAYELSVQKIREDQERKQFEILSKKFGK